MERVLYSKQLNLNSAFIRSIGQLSFSYSANGYRGDHRLGVEKNTMVNTFATTGLSTSRA